MIQNLSVEPASNDPEPLVAPRQSPLLRWLTPALSVALLASIAWHLRDIDMTQAWPTNPLFWIVLFTYWSIGIVGDFIIYRRLWAIPWEGLIALTRKSVGNALLFDLLGETYFYGWARKKLNMATSPFGALKDVTILSALVSNVVTLVMMIFAWPYIERLDLGVTGTAIAASIGVVTLISILIVAFGNKLFSLSKAQLWWVSAVHLTRVLVSTGMIALAWSLYDPTVGFGMWGLLATAKMVASRLPLFVNGDVVFASIVIWFLGRGSQIEQVVAVVTLLTLFIHLVVAGLLALGELLTLRVERQKDGS